MRVLYMDQWTAKTAKENPTWLFLFGDNDKGVGKKGQALLRGQPNAVGIPTKKTARLYSSAFYTDEEYETNCKKITDALAHADDVLQQGNYEAIVLSSGGLGTGLAQLDQRAPRTFAFLGMVMDDWIQAHLGV